jgi:hypothetical protein
LTIAYNQHRFGARLGPMGDPFRELAPLLSTQHLAGIGGLMLSPGKGLLWYSPPLLAALLLGRRLYARWPLPMLLIAAWGTVAVGFYGRLVFWHGDWCWGPRYVAGLGLAAAPLAWLARERWRRGYLLAAAGTLLLVAQAAITFPPPVEAYFRRVVKPLAAQGRVATAPPSRPPETEDWRLWYWTPRHSPLLVQAGAVFEHFTGRSGAPAAVRARDALRLFLALAIPVSALALLARRQRT